MLQLSERLLPKRVLQALAPARRQSFAPTKFVHDCARRYVEYHAHAERKIRAAALIGVFGFPIFYVVWAYVLPQPYESISLRAIGAGLCLLLALAPWWPPTLRRYVVPFSYVTFFYCLPFFFTLMLLLNHSNRWSC